MAGETDENKPDGGGRGRSFVRRDRPKNVRKSEATAPTDNVTSSSTRAPTPHSARDHEDHSRIVVPRQDRGHATPSGLEIELREVKGGSKPGDRYLRVVPSQQTFKGVERGYIEATERASRPLGRLQRIEANVKRLLLGSPFANSRLIEERLNKIKALAIFSSDALSSSAYATEEILLVLVLAGTGALGYSLGVAALIVGLIVIVTISYRQTIKAYPSGGGAYVVADENLGRTAGLVAGGALLVDYVLTVSVSVAAGVAAVTSALPELLDYRVPIGIVMIVLITLGNLRGIREAGTIFAIPTYFFIFSMGIVIIVGMAKVIAGDAPGSLTEAGPPEEQVAATQGVTLFLLMRAFSSGSAALTGIEAISNGVPAFKKPEVKNAQTTMAIMAVLLAVLFLGITFLASRYGLVPSHEETIVSELGKTVLGENVLYYAFQVGTALVLFLAANTSFSAFPPLGAILARDKYLPRQFSFRGDRLAYSNGIMILALASAVLLAAFGGEVSRLIPLYALGVFVSFTLSQSGMVVRWWRLREANWQFGLAISAFGGTCTAIVAVIIGVTKFTHGAWISIVMMGLLMIMFVLIKRHYLWFEKKIAVDEGQLPAGVPAATALEAGVPREHVIVPVDGINKMSLGAIGLAREISPLVTAVHMTEDREHAEEFRNRWEQAIPDVPLMIIESPYRAFVAPMMAYIDLLERTEGTTRRVTVVLPSFVARHWWERLLHNRDVLRLRPYLKNRAGVRVVDFPYSLEREGSRGGPSSSAKPA